MTESNYDSSASGYVTEPFEGLSRTFTDVQTLSTSKVNVVAKGKRYGRWWLLKGLRREVHNEVGYQLRLRKELEILLQLQHPNIVSVIGMEAVGGLGECIVMEYVDGTTLKEWLQGTTTQRQRRRVAHELMEAVGYAHTKGIVHRDLKPENILITANGESVKLVDFGLADTDSHAILKQPAGTLRYMSPEQQQTAVADVRNDIYSLGVIFDEMKLGYGRIVKKCLLPIEKRYQDVAALQSAVLTHSTWRSKIVVTAIVICMLLLSGLIGVQTMRLNSFTTKSQTEQMKQNVTIALLTDSLDRMIAHYRQLADNQEQLKGMQDQQYARKQQVENAVSRGKAEIDKIINNSGLQQHFDTLSNYLYLNSALYEGTLQKVANTPKAYVNKIAVDYTEAELLGINYRLSTHQGNRMVIFMNRYNELLAEYERKLMQGD